MKRWNEGEDKKSLNKGKEHIGNVEYADKNKTFVMGDVLLEKKRKTLKRKMK